MFYQKKGVAQKYGGLVEGNMCDNEQKTGRANLVACMENGERGEQGETSERGERSEIGEHGEQGEKSVRVERANMANGGTGERDAHTMGKAADHHIILP